ncbi:MAG TPA: PQQ-dependent sugar dehydrogenase [Nannocystaceae bacterium]|nr:PQQ-dependent sugar dehydrogenase [Nannocystaceae bacterium]
MQRSTRYLIAALAAPALASLACVVDVGGNDEAVSGGDDNGSTVRHCETDDGSITLPPGFCATVFADEVGKARHLAVSPGGIVFVALAADDDAGPFGVLALADDDDDGVADRTRRFGDGSGNGIAWHDGYLYFARNDSIVRWAMGDAELAPHSHEEVLVTGLPDDGDHTAKSIVIGDDGSIFVNIGSASNACQVDNREPGSPGVDPCPELAVRAGIWRFPAANAEQTAADGERYASGIRNANAIAMHPVTRGIVAVQNGRDQLFDNWPELFDDADDDRLPSEELLLVQAGHDYGWPYCYHDPDLGEMVLAPEYGGDGSDSGRCADVDGPDAWFPAHWAPLGIHFYAGAMFPDRYRRGAFVAFHGSRFEPQATGELPGYNVAFVPFESGRPTGEHMIFADDFAGGARPLPDKAEHRPVGLAEAPDGSLYIGDDQGGRIWRVYYDLGRTP